VREKERERARERESREERAREREREQGREGEISIGRATPDGWVSCQDFALIDKFWGGAKADRHGLSCQEAEPGCRSNQTP